MVLLDSFLSLLGLCRVLFLLRATAWMVVASLATAGARSMLKVEHQAARITVTRMHVVPVQVSPRCTAPVKASVRSTAHTFSLLHTARNTALETWSRPMGGTMEDTSTAASGKTCLSFLMSCLHILSVITANLHVLTPMWITTRLTSLFLGMLASQWLTSSMARPETLMFWL